MLANKKYFVEKNIWLKKNWLEKKIGQKIAKIEKNVYKNCKQK